MNEDQDQNKTTTETQSLKYIDSDVDEEQNEPLTKAKTETIILNIESGDDQNLNSKPISAKFHKVKKQNQTDYDWILALIGSFGFYQKLQFLLVGFLSILPSMLAYSYVFVAATPSFTCKTAVETQISNFDSVIKSLNENETYIKETIRYFHLIRDNENVTYFNNKCEINMSSSSSSFMSVAPKEIKIKRKLKCLEWIYDKSLYGPTIANEWDLICVRSYLKAATQNAYIIGTAGAIVSGIMSDKLGRKTTLFILITLMVFVLNVTQLVMISPLVDKTQKLIIFIISRFFQGFGQTMYSVSFVLLMEITGPKSRVMAGNVMAYSFAIGQMILTALAYYLRDWRNIMWTLAGYVIPFLSLYWLVPESPRWLLNKKKVTEAKIVFKKISSINNSYSYHMISFYKFFGKKNQPNNNDTEALNYHVTNYLKNEETSAYIVSLLQNEANKFNKKNVQTYRKTFNEIKKSKKFLIRCFILFYIWMVILMVYLGMGMGISNAMDKHVNPYLIFLIQACCEFIGIVTCHLSLNTFGRKIPLILFMALASTSIFFIPVFYSKYPFVSCVFYLLAKYSVSAAQLTCMIFTTEIYPTSMRGTGMGLSVCLARVGGVWAPQINVLGSRFGFYVPYMIFSSLSLIAALLAFILPETMNKKLPESASESNKLDNKDAVTRSKI